MKNLKLSIVAGLVAIGISTLANAGDLTYISKVNKNGSYTTASGDILTLDYDFVNSFSSRSLVVDDYYVVVSIKNREGATLFQSREKVGTDQYQGNMSFEHGMENVNEVISTIRRSLGPATQKCPIGVNMDKLLLSAMFSSIKVKSMCGNTAE